MIKDNLSIPTLKMPSPPKKTVEIYYKIRHVFLNLTSAERCLLNCQKAEEVWGGAAARLFTLGGPGLWVYPLTLRGHQSQSLDFWHLGIDRMAPMSCDVSGF